MTLRVLVILWTYYLEVGHAPLEQRQKYGAIVARLI